MAARLGQAFGYRRVFLAGVSLFSLASLACGLAPDPVVLVIARVLQGAAAGLMFPQTGQRLWRAQRPMMILPPRRAAGGILFN